MKLKIVNKSNNPTPAYQTSGSAGMDVCANLEFPVHVQPGSKALIPTGIYMAIEEGYECQVRPRSGLAAKYGITVLNSPGTIDSDYRGEIIVILHNASSVSYLVNHGDRIAQLVFAKVERVEVEQFITLDTLDSTDRGEGGFGSTGK